MGLFIPNDGYTRETFGGNRDNFDADGNRIGYSQKRLDGGLDIYDRSGTFLGCARPNFGGMEYLDASGQMVGYSITTTAEGGAVYYDKNGTVLGHTTGGFGLQEFYKDKAYSGGLDGFISLAHGYS